MKRNTPSLRGGFTLIELLVVIAIIALLASLSIPAVGGAIVKAQLAQAVSNARQIHIATTGAAADSSAQNDNSIGWPADQTPVASTAGAFIQSLIDGGYLKFGDLKVFGAGKMVYDGGDSFDAAKHCGFTFKNLSDADEGSAIFLLTRNVTIDDDKGATSKMDKTQSKVFADHGFVVFHKGGDGTYFLKDKNGDGNFGTQPINSKKALDSTGSVTKPK